MAASSTTLELEEIQSIYTSELTISLQKMRKEGTLCDCVLACGGAEFPVHSILMCAGSPYFRNKLSKSRNIPSRIELPPTIEPAALQIILTYLYAGSINDLKDHINILPSVLKAAEFFQLHILHEYCWNIAMNRLTVDTFAEIWCMADTCDDSQLMPSLTSFMGQNLDMIIATEGFWTLPLHRLRPFLEQLRLKHQPPDLMVRGILNWIRANVPVRERHLQDLFSTVDLKSLSNQYVKTLVKEDDIIKTSPDVYNQLIAVAMDRLHIEPTHSLKNLRMISFTYDEGRPADVRQCNLDTQRWSRRMPLDLSLSYGTAAAYLHGYVYFFGGGREPNEASELVSICNIEQNAVICTTVMNYLRFQPGAVALQNQLYVIGGANARGNMRQVERYDPATDSWSVMASTVNSHSCPNVVATENAIFVVGSWDCNIVERYNVATDSWSVVSGIPSLSNNISPSVTTCLDRIYLAKNIQERQIHIFDPLNEGWSVMPFGMGEGFAVHDIWNVVNGPLSKPFVFVLTRGNELFSYNCLESKMEKCLDAPLDFPVKRALTFFAVVS